MKDEITKTLKEIGLKVTPQRQAILRLLDGNKSHPSADSIYNEVLKEYPAISFATVYNTLSKLAESGKLQELDIDPGRKRFDPCTVPHVHFYCRACGNVFDIICDTPYPVSIEDVKIVGEHHVEIMQLNFKGLCKDCIRKQQHNHSVES